MKANITSVLIKASFIALGVCTVAPVAMAQNESKVNQKAEAKTPAGKKVTYGKYGCTSTSGSAFNGTFSIQPRGSFVITAGGKYTYHGYEKPSSGTFTVDAKGVLHFKGGVFNGGEATPLGEGYPDQFFLVYPTIPGNRWKCKLVK